MVQGLARRRDVLVQEAVAENLADHTHRGRAFSAPPSPSLLQGLERLYARFNRREFVIPDPLQVVYRYPEIRDREVVALLAAGLAFGRVNQILSAIERVLLILGPRPALFLAESKENQIHSTLASFRYRFVAGHELSSLLLGLKRVLIQYGSVEALFKEHLQPAANNLLPRLLEEVVSELLFHAGLEKSYLLPNPARGSACKRLFLFLRWMVRQDHVDPGGWNVVSPSDLIVPLDTHMFHIAKDLGLTRRKQANLKTAIEITHAFRQINPEDPVKYDFVITRFGIRDDLQRHQIKGAMKL